jgi:hypothetical protein
VRRLQAWWAVRSRSVPVADGTRLPRAQAPSVFFGHGGSAWGAGAPATCCEASEGGGSRLTARSIFGFPSASEGYAASVSVSHSCAALGDDGAEVDSGAAHGAQAMPLALQDRAPPGFFDQLGPPPGLEMYYGAGGVARQDHMAVDAAAVVPYAPASRKRSAQDDWAATERPARVFRSVYDTAADHHMDPAVDQVRFLRVAAAFAPLIQALRSLTDASTLPTCDAAGRDVHHRDARGAGDGHGAGLELPGAPERARAADAACMRGDGSRSHHAVRRGAAPGACAASSMSVCVRASEAVVGSCGATTRTRSDEPRCAQSRVALPLSGRLRCAGALTPLPCHASTRVDAPRMHARACLQR